MSILWFRSAAVQHCGRLRLCVGGKVWCVFLRLILRPTECFRGPFPGMSALEASTASTKRKESKGKVKGKVGKGEGKGGWSDKPDPPIMSRVEQWA